MSFVLFYQFMWNATEHLDMWEENRAFTSNFPVGGDENLCALIDTCGSKDYSISFDSRSQRIDLLSC